MKLGHIFYSVKKSPYLEEYIKLFILKNEHIFETKNIWPVTWVFFIVDVPRFMKIRLNS